MGILKKRPVIKGYKPDYSKILKEDKEIWGKEKLSEDNSWFKRTANSLNCFFKANKISKNKKTKISKNKHKKSKHKTESKKTIKVKKPIKKKK